MPNKPHDPTLWLESDSDLSSEPSDLPNAQLSEVEAVFERLFQRLRLLDLLKVDAGEQVRAVMRAHSRGASTPHSRRGNRANPNPERARTRSATETSTRARAVPLRDGLYSHPRWTRPYSPITPSTRLFDDHALVGC
jgi:hypothetical protein